MLTITPLTNVKNTINNNKRNIRFTSGVQTNYGANVINNTADIKHEGNFLTDFLGTIKDSPLFYDAFYKRQMSIEQGLDAQENKLNAIA